MRRMLLASLFLAACTGGTVATTSPSAWTDAVDAYGRLLRYVFRPNDGLDVNVEVGRDGSLNLAEFMDRLVGRYTAVSSGERPPLRWLLQHAQLRDGKLTFSDLSGQTPLRTMVAPINFEVLNLATLPDRHGRYAISAALPDGGTIAWHGDVSLLPTASSGELEVKGVKLAAVWAFVRDELRLAEPDGSVDVATRYRFGYGIARRRSDWRTSALRCAGWRSAPRAAAIRSSGWTRSRRAGPLDLATRELVVPSIELANGSVTVIRTRRPNCAPRQLHADREAQSRSRERRRPRPGRGRLSSRRSGAGPNVALRDSRYEQPIAYDASLSPPRRPGTSRAMGRRRCASRRRSVAQGGTVDGSGTIAQSFDGIEARVEMPPGRAGALRPCSPATPRSISGPARVRRQPPVGPGAW
jgi:hypothetical protein